MQVFILTGSEKNKKDYIDTFSKKYAIKSFFIHDFLEFKISDARGLKQLLSKKLHSSEKQLITIKKPTSEAQNAILKLTEELPESAFIFFLVNGRDDLLPTIVSRSSVIDLGGVSQEFTYEDIAKELKSVLSDPSQFLYFCNSYATDKESIHHLILCLRSIVIENPNNAHAYFLLKKMTEIFPFINQNNVQARFSLEATLFNIDPF